MPALYSSANWNTHREVAIRRIEYPFETDPTAFHVIRTYEGPLSSYAEADIDDHDTEFDGMSGAPLAFLTHQSPIENLDGGQVRYQRIFSTKPAQRVEFEAVAFRYPGYDVTGTSREPFTLTVSAQVTYDYFWVSDDGAADETDADDITLPAPFAFGGNYLTDSTSPTQSTYAGTVSTGGYTLVLDVALRRWTGNIYERVTRKIVPY